jgi:excisionase family DNA binding protein
MTASTEPLHSYDPGLTIGQAASRLNVSPSTARRWVRSGRLRSTQVTVGDGFEYRISPEALEGVNPSTNPSNGQDVEPSADPSMKGSEPTALEASVERSSAVAAYNAQLLAPLVAVIERQAEQLVTQAETIGRQSERVAGLELENTRLSVALRAEREARSSLTASTAPGSVEPPSDTLLDRWRSWAPWLLGVLAIVAMVGLLVVPR